MNKLSKQLILKAKLSSKDLLVFQVSFLIRQWYMWILILSSLSSIGVIVYRLATGEISEVPTQSWFFSLILIIFLLSLFINSRKSIKNKFVYEEKTYKISEEYFMMETESTTQKVLWKDFVKYILTKRFVYLFVSNNSAHLVPLDELTNDEKLFLIQIVKSKVNKQKSGCILALIICLVLFLVTVGIVQYFLS
jgi:hypothetical protein